MIKTGANHIKSVSRQSDRQGKTAKRLDCQRLGLFYKLVLLAGVVLSMRLMQIQIFLREKYSVIADKQFKYEVALAPERGGIFDRRLRPIAMNVPSYTIVAFPKDIKNIASTAAILAKHLHMSTAQIEQKLQGKKSFVYITRRASRLAGLTLKTLSLPGIECRMGMARQYPKGTVGCHLVGFTDVDGRGVSGVELSYDGVLQGVPGKVILQQTASGRRKFQHSDYPMQDAENGEHVVLTIDYAIQSIAQKELRRSLAESNADTGTVIIMNPMNGEILAMAVEPSYDPNTPGKFAPATWRLRAITDLFEPGSTFKLVTMAAVLNENLRKPTDHVFCENGKFNIMHETIHDVHPYGNLTLHDVLVKSSNIGMAKTALGIDKALIYRYARDFGFGSRTGIELKGEEDGILNPMDRWSGFTPLAMSYGHEVGVTPLQMCNMFSAIANGGLLMQPHLIKEIRDQDQNVTYIAEEKIFHRVISLATANTLKSMMLDVVREGTGQKAALPGVDVCGKTGTARKVRMNGGGYIADQHVANFGGFFPAERPQYAMYVMIDNPRGSYLGGDVAAPCFRRIAGQIMFYKGVEIEADDEQVVQTMLAKQSKRQAPNFIGYDRDEAKDAAEAADLHLAFSNKGDLVTGQVPKAGSLISADELIRLQCAPEQERDVTSRPVPNVLGLPIRSALNLLGEQGIHAVVTGSGRVVRQQPAAGSRLRATEQVLLQCESSVDLRKLLLL
jgi:cell division protein FtsI (penicillin-binding protein 3)